MNIKYTISVVSHGHGFHLFSLFSDLNNLINDSFEVLLTINIPEDEYYISTLNISNFRIIRNAQPKGFGANHNNAFKCSAGKRFIVINPDVRINAYIFNELERHLTDGVAVCAPSVFNLNGEIEDSVRKYPSLKSLYSRIILKDRKCDYELTQNIDSVIVDWTAGMFLFIDSEAFRRINGFDSSYYMYLEDVDLCQRFNRSGYKVIWVPNCKIIHNAQRDSRRKFKFLLWHSVSMIKFLYKNMLFIINKKAR